MAAHVISWAARAGALSVFSEAAVLSRLRSALGTGRVRVLETLGAFPASALGLHMEVSGSLREGSQIFGSILGAADSWKLSSFIAF